MKRIKKIAAETWKLIRFLATGRTNSRRDRAALAAYGRYQAQERAREQGSRP